MAFTGAYQTSNFAYQGSGQFAYQEAIGDAVLTQISGVRGKKHRVIINLSEVSEASRQSTADFIKSRLVLKKAPDDVELVVKPKGDTNVRKRKKTSTKPDEERQKAEILMAEMLENEDFIIAAIIASEL